MDRVWGYRDYAGGRVVDSHVARIRRKLGDEAAEPKYIRTVHGVGYAFREDGRVMEPGPALLAAARPAPHDPGEARRGDRLRGRP